MEDWTKRFAVSALVGFFAFVFAVPVSCCGFVLYNQHLYGDAESAGPAAILQALGVSAAVGLLLGYILWRRSGPR